ncbi:unnamed protein product [Effrenium voratum]|nr:unnamed protein product [Effrenium voratum]
MGLDAAIFGNFVLRTSIAQLGSKTFFLSAILAAWCPWEGIRNHPDRQVQTVLILTGSYLAFVLRICLLIFVQDKTWQFCAFDAMSCFFLFALGMKARVDLSSSDAREARQRYASSSHGADAAGGAPSDPEKPKESGFSEWNTAAFGFLPAPLPEPRPWNLERANWATVWEDFESMLLRQKEAKTTQYGTETQFVPSDGVLSSRPSDRSISTVLSLLLPLLLVFLMQADDRAIMLLVQTGIEGADAICGSLLGLLMPTMLSVTLGVLLEKTLTDSRLLFTVSITLLTLSFISFTQAMLYLDAARPVQQKAMALISMFAESCPLLRVSFLWAIGAEATSEEDGKHCQGPKRAPACAKKLGQVLRRGACDRKRGGSDVVCSC